MLYTNTECFDHFLIHFLIAPVKLCYIHLFHTTMFMEIECITLFDMMNTYVFLEQQPILVTKFIIDGNSNHDDFCKPVVYSLLEKLLETRIQSIDGQKSGK